VEEKIKTSLKRINTQINVKQKEEKAQIVKKLNLLGNI
jgi:hypothetical protein